MKKYTQNIGKKFLALFAGLFILANILPLCTAIVGTSENFTPITYADETTTDATTELSDSQIKELKATGLSDTEIQTLYSNSLKDATTAEQKAIIDKAISDAKAKAEAQKKNDESLIDQINSEEGSEMRKKITEFATLIVSLFTPIIAMAVKFAGILMGDAFILGANGETNAFPVASLLYELWDVVRTIVNYAFLLILLFVAVMNIFPMQQDKYQLQSILPSLVIGIVTVNMTWFMTRVIFDAVEVATHVVYALPESIANKNAGDKKLFSFKKCIVNQISPSDWDNENNKANDGVTEEKGEEGKQKPYTHGACYPAYISLNLKRSATAVDIKETNNANTFWTADSTDSDDKALEALGDLVVTQVNYGATTIYWSDFNTDNFNEGTILPLMAFSMMQIQNLPRMANVIKETTGDDGEFILPDNWTSLFINTVLALVLMVIILILFVTMVVNLFGRVIILWINIIASPLIALNIVAEKAGIAGASVNNEYIGADTFLKQAFAPAIMGIPFVIGFILISVGQQYPLPGFVSTGGINNTGALVDGLASIHSLFYHFLTIAVLWAGGVKAMELTKNPITGGFTDGIISTVQGASSFISSLPMQIPIIPIGDIDKDGEDERASLNNIFKDALQGYKNTLNSKDDKVGAYFRKQDPSPSVMERTFNNARLTQKEAKEQKELLNDIKLNLQTFRDIDSSNGPTESAKVQSFLGDHNFNSKLISRITTKEQLAGMLFESQNDGKYADSEAGKAAINSVLPKATTPSSAGSTPAGSTPASSSSANSSSAPPTST